MTNALRSSREQPTNQGLKYQSDKNFANSPLPLKATIMIKCEIQSYHPQCNVAHVSIGSMAESVHTYIVFSNQHSQENMQAQDNAKRHSMKKISKQTNNLSKGENKQRQCLLYAQVFRTHVLHGLQTSTDHRHSELYQSQEFSVCLALSQSPRSKTQRHTLYMHNGVWQLKFRKKDEN